MGAVVNKCYVCWDRYDIVVSPMPMYVRQSDACNHQVIPDTITCTESGSVRARRLPCHSLCILLDCQGASTSRLNKVCPKLPVQWPKYAWPKLPLLDLSQRPASLAMPGSA